MIVHPRRGFECPLRDSDLTRAVPFSDYDAANAAVSRFKELPETEEINEEAHRIFLRHWPLIRKALHRFCRRSRCYPGECRTEDLVGNTYPIFRQALTEYDASHGVDFVGYLSQRLYWGLQHDYRRLESATRCASCSDGDDAASQAATNGQEEQMIDRIFVRELLGRLDKSDAELLSRYACGHSHRELAESVGISAAAMRKRLERLRTKLREMSWDA